LHTFAVLGIVLPGLIVAAVADVGVPVVDVRVTVVDVSAVEVVVVVDVDVDVAVSPIAVPPERAADGYAHSEGEERRTRWVCVHGIRRIGGIGPCAIYDRRVIRRYVN